MAEEHTENPFNAIAPLLTATGGLTLAQVSEVTGIEPTTIQNWIKRGWVASPQAKRYGEAQLMRIILINMLRGSMQLDAIAELMAYINGSVEDKSDDILSDRELFSRLCRVILRADEHIGDLGVLCQIVSEEVRTFQAPSRECGEKLKEALLIMALVYQSTQLKELAMQEYAKIDCSSRGVC
jgi:DNA-binding transcriptional MerR regulator